MQTKHALVRERVLDLVDSLRIGEAIPPERQLSEEFGVARMTLRRAVDDLVREGYLVRRQGSGTFVAEPKITQQLTVTSFSEDMRQRGMQPSSRTLSLEHIAAGARIGRHLEVSPFEPVIKAVRLRLADGESMAIETLHVPQALVPGLTAYDLERGSFYEIVEHRYGISISSGMQIIEATVTSEEESSVLGVPLHSPAFLFERTTRDAEDRVIEFVRSIYRGDRYQLVSELRAPFARLRPSEERAGRP